MDAAAVVEAEVEVEKTRKRERLAVGHPEVGVWEATPPPTANSDRGGGPFCDGRVAMDSTHCVRESACIRV